MAPKKNTGTGVATSQGGGREILAETSEHNSGGSPEEQSSQPVITNQLRTLTESVTSLQQNQQLLMDALLALQRAPTLPSSSNPLTSSQNGVLPLPQNGSEANLA
ncbi:hypothetical protein CsSME_00026855 [Camellia sinensis var. sinensis]